MHIFYGSDFHSDMWTGKTINDVITQEYDLYLLAGDLGEHNDGAPDARILTLLPEDKVLWVPGNHEYYFGEYNTVNADINHPGFLFNERRDFPGFSVWGSTFWTNFMDSQVHADTAQRYMNDYRYIKYDDRLLTPGDTAAFHAEARRSLRKAWEERPEGQFIVMTHHSPSFQSTPKQYRKPAYMEEAMLNAAYSSAMEDWLRANKIYPDIWIHGHIHEPVNYEIDLDGHKMQVLSSPYGYPGEMTKYTNRSFEC